MKKELELRLLERVLVASRNANNVRPCPMYRDAIHNINLLIENRKSKPELEVFFGSFPESTGDRNWSVLLCRSEDKGLDKITNGIGIHRSEYYGRAMYEADCLRYLIGETSEEPSMSNYDFNVKTCPEDQDAVKTNE